VARPARHQPVRRKRQGSSAAVLNTFRIIRTNVMKVVTSVNACDRCIQSAINIRGKKMQRRAEFLLTRGLRQSGWK
jgi:hypothetical protein